MLCGVLLKSNEAKEVMRAFYGAQLRFFRQLVTAATVGGSTRALGLRGSGVWASIFSAKRGDAHVLWRAAELLQATGHRCQGKLAGV